MDASATALLQFPLKVGRGGQGDCCSQRLANYSQSFVPQMYAIAFVLARAKLPIFAAKN